MLAHQFRRRATLHISRLEVCLFDPAQLRNYPEHSHLGHQVFTLLLGGVDVDQGLAEVESRQVLVRIVPDLGEDWHVIVILNHLVMRTSKPREAERVTECRVDKRSKKLDSHLVERFRLGRGASSLLDDRDDLTRDAMVADVLEELHGAGRDDAGLGCEHTHAFQRGKLTQRLVSAFNDV